MANQLNCSFDSPMSPDPSDRWTKLVKTKATAMVDLKGAPRKVHKLNLEMEERDDEVYGSIHFTITPQRTPNCLCPDAPKPIRAKLLVKLEHIKKLVLVDDDEEEIVDLS